MIAVGAAVSIHIHAALGFLDDLHKHSRSKTASYDSCPRPPQTSPQHTTLPSRQLEVHHGSRFRRPSNHRKLLCITCMWHNPLTGVDLQVAILFPPAAAAFITGCSCDLLINICLTMCVNECRRSCIPADLDLFLSAWDIFRDT